MAQARTLGNERTLLLGLFLASDLLGAALPKKVSQRVWADPKVKALAERTCEQLFRETDYPAGFLEGHEGAPVVHNREVRTKDIEALLVSSSLNRGSERAVQRVS